MITRLTDAQQHHARDADRPDGGEVGAGVAALLHVLLPVARPPVRLASWRRQVMIVNHKSTAASGDPLRAAGCRGQLASSIRLQVRSRA